MTMRGTGRWADSPRAALERNRTEDARLVQRINAAAAELHRVWSADWRAEAEEHGRPRARAVALQAEIDGLYAQRRQLTAERALLQDAPAAGRRHRAMPRAVAA